MVGQGKKQVDLFPVWKKELKKEGGRQKMSPQKGKGKLGFRTNRKGTDRKVH